LNLKNFKPVKSIEDLDEVSKGVVWQNFEKLAAFIFEENGYPVKINTVKVFYRKRRQYDIIAKKSCETFWWSARNGQAIATVCHL
jgi:hypothetical protein